MVLLRTNRAFQNWYPDARTGPTTDHEALNRDHNRKLQMLWAALASHLLGRQYCHDTISMTSSRELTCDLRSLFRSPVYFCDIYTAVLSCIAIVCRGSDFRARGGEHAKHDASATIIERAHNVSSPPATQERVSNRRNCD
jgi:hypothetical protein